MSTFYHIKYMKGTKVHTLFCDFSMANTREPMNLLALFYVNPFKDKAQKCVIKIVCFSNSSGKKFVIYKFVYLI